MFLSSCEDKEYISNYNGYSGFGKISQINYYDVATDSLISTTNTGDSIYSNGYFVRIHYQQLQSLFIIQNGWDTCLSIPDLYFINYVDTPYFIRFTTLSSHTYSVWFLDTISFRSEFYNLPCN